MSSVSTTTTEAAPRHPRGLSTLFFTEMWERCSYYGMRALLVLFMTAAAGQGGLGFSDKLAGAMQSILKTPESIAFLATKGSDLMPYAPQAMRAFHQAEIARFRRVAQAAGIQPE